LSDLKVKSDNGHLHNKHLCAP